MHNIVIDTNYDYYDGIKYYSYENLFQTPVEKVLDSLLEDIDTTKLCGNVQIITTNSFMYDELVQKYIRFLFRIPLSDYIKYNKYVQLLLDRHQENLDFEASIVNNIVTPKNNKKPSNKKKVPNKFVRTETHNLFTGELEYDYTNFATGESFISTNPNLLDELNSPKKKKKVKKEQRKEFGKIILNFKLK